MSGSSRTKRDMVRVPIPFPMEESTSGNGVMENLGTVPNTTKMGM